MGNGIIKILMNEHENILKFTNKLKNNCLVFMEENRINTEEFYNAIDFIKNYADGRHHRKEEDILFRAMLNHLGDTAEKLVRYGMITEHDMARFQVGEMEKFLKAYEMQPNPSNKLNLIANTMSYCYLLERHAEKEDKVVYPYAIRSLSVEIMKELDVKADEYEKSYTV